MSTNGWDSASSGRRMGRSTVTHCIFLGLGGYVSRQQRVALSGAVGFSLPSVLNPKCPFSFT